MEEEDEEIMEEEDDSMTQKIPSVRFTHGSGRMAPEAPVPSSSSHTSDENIISPPDENTITREERLDVPETPLPSSPLRWEALARRVRLVKPRLFSSPEAALVHLIEEQCRSFCLSLFFREQNPVRSLGITSSIPGEGKSFIASMMAHMLANDSLLPVTLIECDWENPGLHDYFGLPATPGLAEWLRKECTEQDIRHKVGENLTIIPAGDGHQDAVKLLQQVRRRGLLDTFAHGDENLLVDLPAVTTTSYSIFAASMVDAVSVVVRAGVTPDNVIADACTRLKGLPVQGVILNQVKSHFELRSSARKKS